MTGKRVFRRFLICLIMALCVSAAAAPVLHSDSYTAWAKSGKKKKADEKKRKAEAKKEKNVIVSSNVYAYSVPK